jgi:hypothetical protein
MDTKTASDDMDTKTASDDMDTKTATLTIWILIVIRCTFSVH